MKRSPSKYHLGYLFSARAEPHKTINLLNSKSESPPHHISRATQKFLSLYTPDRLESVSNASAAKTTVIRSNKPLEKAQASRKTNIIIAQIAGS